MNTSPMHTDRGSRIIFVEFIVGVIMVFVVMVHGMWNLCDVSSSFANDTGVSYVEVVTNGLGPLGIVAECLYSFMFVFFIISGYFYKPDRNPKVSLYRRIRKLLPMFLVCIVALPLITYAVMCVCGTTLTIDRIISDNTLMLLGESFIYGLGYSLEYVAPTTVLGPYYFIEIVLFADIIFFLTARKLLSNTYTTVASIIVLLLIGGIMVVLKLGIFNIDKSFIAVAFMLVGAYLKKIQFFETMRDRVRMPRYWIVFLVALVCGIVLATYFPTGMAFNHSSIGSHGVFSAFTLFASGLTSTIVLTTVLWLLFQMPGIKQVFSFIGRYPFQILLFNIFYLVIPALIIKGEQPRSVFFDTIPEAGIYVVFSIVMCVLTAVVLEKIVRQVKA